MRTIHLVTHPEATHHLQRVVGGWHDSALTPAGLRSAAAIARILRERIPDGAHVEVITSDLLRTRQTAEAIGEAFSLKPILEPRLREKSFGEAEGGPQAWLDERYVPPPATGDRLEYDTGVPGAETYGTVARRVYQAVDELSARPAEHQIVVTHGYAATHVIAAWIRMPVESVGHVIFHMSSGSITTLHEDDHYRSRRLVTLGETAHLRG
jgi:probable phosphoglycerate mutase